MSARAIQGERSVIHGVIILNHEVIQANPQDPERRRGRERSHHAHKKD